MPTADTPLRVSAYSQQSIVKYVSEVLRVQNNDASIRNRLTQQDRNYQRETDWTPENLALRNQVAMGQATKMPNITVPVVMPQVESAYSYLVETFLSSYPIFPVVSGPEYTAIAEQVDAVMAEAAQRFQYAQQLALCFRDGLKHNILAIEVDWKVLKTYTVETRSADMRFGTPVETEYAGNLLKRVNLYNAVFDPRVPISQIHSKGDYAGYTERMTYIQLKNLFLELDQMNTMNADEAFKSATPVATQDGTSALSATYIPQVNPDALRSNTLGNTNWLNWVGLSDLSRPDVNLGKEYEVTTLYMRIIPRTFGINVGKERGINGVPQIFKTIVVNNQVTIYLEHKSNAHNYLPIIVAPFIEDGLEYQTKSFADNAITFQQLSSALYNSALASQRRKVYDRLFYDPLMYNKSDMDRIDPVARIPLKQGAYGKPVSEGVMQLPYRDEGIPNILAMARDVSDMSDVALGQNKVQRGQFQKGNKTRAEFETVMDKSDLRIRAQAVVLETTWFQPIKHILKMNILQYQPPTELFNLQTQQNVKVSPEDLRKVAWQFQIADGIMPVSKLLNPELFERLLQYSGALAQLGRPMPYDLVSMGIYSLKLQGASWVDAFKIDPQQQQQQMQQQANLQAQAKGVAPGQQPQGPQ